MSKITVSFSVEDDQREMLESAFASHELSFLSDCKNANERDLKLSNTEILIAWNPTNELKAVAAHYLQHVRFVQLISAGYDHVRLEMFAPGCMVAANQGAYALPMAEHVLAMILERAKKLREYHGTLAEGRFDQRSSQTKQITGSTLGIIGFGSIGKETARLMRPFNVKILALNTTGTTDQRVDFCGTIDNLDFVLENSDFVLLSLPLTRETDGLIGRTQLERMKSDATLVNVARGAIVRQQDLYQHLKSHPGFSACVDAWWVEPFRQGEFRLDFPFFELPNLLGSPHNSALVGGIMLQAVSRAAGNVDRYIQRGTVSGLVTGAPTGPD